MHDGDWPIQRVSDEIETITGFPADDFVDATKLESITHPEDAEPVQEAIAAAIAADRPWVLEFRIVHADGGIRWIHERGVKTVSTATVGSGSTASCSTSRSGTRQSSCGSSGRVERLRVSESRPRATIIAAADEARRRIERDLHDGAQQRLVVASLHLGAARRKASADGAVAPLLDAARAELDAGLAELRELARGIHPAVLTDRGLVPAVEALVRRSTVPVAFDEDDRPAARPRRRDGAVLRHRRGPHERGALRGGLVRDGERAARRRRREGRDRGRRPRRRRPRARLGHPRARGPAECRRRRARARQPVWRGHDGPRPRAARRPRAGVTDRSAAFPLGAAVTLEQLERDPHPMLARLRAEEPVSWLPALDGWIVTRRDLAMQVMRDAAAFTVDDPRFSTAQVVGPSMLSLDGDAHRRHRDPFARPVPAARGARAVHRGSWRTRPTA